MANRFTYFFIHEAGWFLFAMYLLSVVWWYYVCFKNGAVSWGSAIKKWNELWPEFLRAPTWVYSPLTLKLFMCIFMAFFTLVVILVLITNVLGDRGHL